MANEIANALIPIAALLVSALIVAGLWYWWSGSRSGDTLPLSPPVEHAPPEQPGVSVLSRVVGAPAPAAGEEEPAELMRVLRDVTDGALLVEMDGRRYRSLEEMEDAQVGRRFVGNVISLVRFAGLAQDALSVVWPQDEAGVKPAREAAQAVPPGSGVPPPAGQRGLFGLGRKPARPQAAPPATIAEQIDELLQKRLALAPDLALRDIHLHTAPDGGVLVEVDGRFYEGVGAVPDPACREFIEKTIREWESRQ